MLSWKGNSLNVELIQKKPQRSAIVRNCRVNCHVFKNKIKKPRELYKKKKKEEITNSKDYFAFLYIQQCALILQCSKGRKYNVFSWFN